MSPHDRIFMHTRQILLIRDVRASACEYIGEVQTSKMAETTFAQSKKNVERANENFWPLWPSG